MHTQITASELKSTAGCAQCARPPALASRTASMQARSMFSKPQKFWTQNREASLNWLALGLLLAAWNAADGGDDLSTPRRPDALRGYLAVSVRAVQRPARRFDDASQAGDF